MNGLAREVLAVKDSLPVFTKEIGDTWIHGAGCDPWKVRQFREMLRREPEWTEEERKEAFRELLLVPEHTWGMDIKTHLADHEHYIRTEFEKVRKTAPNYQKVEASWEEQRDYVRRAMDSLSPEHKEALAEFGRDACPDGSGFVPVDMDGEYSAAGWDFRFGTDGSLRKLERNGRAYADDAHRWGEVLYENYSPEDYRKFYQAYATCDVGWAREDFGKIGMEKAIAVRLQTTPVLKALLRKDNEFLARMEMKGTSPCGGRTSRPAGSRRESGADSARRKGRKTAGCASWAAGLTRSASAAAAGCTSTPPTAASNGTADSWTPWTPPWFP